MQKQDAWEWSMASRNEYGSRQRHITIGERYVFALGKGSSVLGSRKGETPGVLPLAKLAGQRVAAQHGFVSLCRKVAFDFPRKFWWLPFDVLHGNTDHPQAFRIEAPLVFALCTREV